jgi:hypothetical protein
MKIDDRMDMLNDLANRQLRSPIYQMMDELAARVVADRYRLVPDHLSSGDFAIKSSLEITAAVSLFKADFPDWKTRKHDVDTTNLGAFRAVMNNVEKGDFAEVADILEDYLDSRQNQLVKMIISAQEIDEARPESQTRDEITEARASTVAMFKRMGMETLQVRMMFEVPDGKKPVDFVDELSARMFSDLDAVVDLRPFEDDRVMAYCSRKQMAAVEELIGSDNFLYLENLPAELIPGYKDSEDFARIESTRKGRMEESFSPG